MGCAQGKTSLKTEAMVLSADCRGRGFGSIGRPKQLLYLAERLWKPLMMEGLHDLESAKIKSMISQH